MQRVEELLPTKAEDANADANERKVWISNYANLTN